MTSSPRFTAGGGTTIAGAMLQAFDLLAHRKREYRANGVTYFRPLVFLITDAYPEHDSPEEIEEPARRTGEEEAGRHSAFFAFGIEGADIDKLAEITPPDRPPHFLHQAQIGDIFQWLANSVTSVSTSQPGTRLRLLDPTAYLREHQTSPWEHNQGEARRAP